MDDFVAAEAGRIGRKKNTKQLRRGDVALAAVNWRSGKYFGREGFARLCFSEKIMRGDRDANMTWAPVATKRLTEKKCPIEVGTCQQSYRRNWKGKPLIDREIRTVPVPSMLKREP